MNKSGNYFWIFEDLERHLWRRIPYSIILRSRLDVGGKRSLYMRNLLPFPHAWNWCDPSQAPLMDCGCHAPANNYLAFLINEEYLYLQYLPVTCFSNTLCNEARLGYSLLCFSLICNAFKKVDGMSFMAAPKPSSFHNAAPNILQLLSYYVALLIRFYDSEQRPGFLLRNLLSQLNMNEIRIKAK
jgi:hypothetical protein